MRQPNHRLSRLAVATPARARPPTRTASARVSKEGCAATASESGAARLTQTGPFAAWQRARSGKLPTFKTRRPPPPHPPHPAAAAGSCRKCCRGRWCVGGPRQSPRLASGAARRVGGWREGTARPCRSVHRRLPHAPAGRSGARTVTAAGAGQRAGPLPVRARRRARWQRMGPRRYQCAIGSVAELQTVTKQLHMEARSGFFH